ncbi:MAG: ABC transporter permease, partial [Acidimicrobiales bacterium]
APRSAAEAGAAGSAAEAGVEPWASAAGAGVEPTVRAAVAGRWRGALWLSELKLVFRRRRTVALLVLLAAIPILAAVAIKILGSGGGGGPAFVGDITHNGLFVALGGLTLAIGFPLPLAIAVVAGDSIAGEAGMGTLRYLLVRPAGRTALLAAKFGSIVAFCVVAALVVACAGLAMGAILFPLGPLTSLSGFGISVGVGLGRVFESAGIVGVSMIGLAAIGLFISTLTEVGVGAMAGTLGAYIAVEITNLVPQVSVIHPELFLHHWSSFGDLLRVPASYGAIEADLLLQLCWAAVFLTAAWARFTTADILA